MSIACLPLISALCEKVRSLPFGDAAEIGVHRGDSAQVICRDLPQCKVHLYDTFSGHPGKMVSHIDVHKAGNFSDTSLEFVCNRLEKETNAIFHQGIFDGSQTPVGPLRFVHVDVDLYLSTKAVLEWSWGQMVIGGIVLCDDYQCSTCPGATRAWDEWCAGKCVLSAGSRAYAVKE